MNREQIIDLIDRKIDFEDMKKAGLALRKHYEVNVIRLESAEVKTALQKGHPVAIRGKLIIGYNPLKKAFETSDDDFLQIERPVEAIEIVEALPEREFFAITGRNEWGDISEYNNIIGNLRLGEIYLPKHSAIFNFLNPTAETKKEKIQSVLNGVQIIVYERENYVDNCLHEIGHLFWRTCTRFEEKMLFKELFKHLRTSCIYEYAWEKNTEEEVFCTIYKWYMKSVLINKSFYNILEYEEPYGLKLLQSVFDRIAKERIIDDIWEMSKEDVIEYLNPPLDKTTGKYIRKSGMLDKIKDIELPESVLNKIESVQNGQAFVGLGKACVPVNQGMIDFEKAKDLSKLTRKQITDKRGHVRTVWVKTGQEDKKSLDENQAEKIVNSKEFDNDIKNYEESKKSAIDKNYSIGQSIKSEIEKIIPDFSERYKHWEEGKWYEKVYGQNEKLDDMLETMSYAGPLTRATIESGLYGFDKPKVTIGWRYGDLPKSGESRNYAENKAEAGVSFMQVKGESKNKGMAGLAHKEDKTAIVIAVGFKHPFKKGSDGEPLLLAPQKVNSEQSMQKAVNLEKPTIFLDMDGVVTWFSEHYKNLFNRDVFKDDSFTVTQFCLTQPRFFRDIPVLERGKELYNRLSKKYQVIFLTTPMEGMEYCKADKLAWLKDNICKEPTVIFSDCKADYANSEKDILIDDMSHNLESFYEAGGTAIDFTKMSNDEILAKIAETLNPQAEIIQIKQQIKEMKVNTEPSERQIKSENYKKGDIIYKNFKIKIENVPGSIRFGFNDEGKKWVSRMKNYYGYIQGIEGADGDAVDCFISENNLSTNKCYVINQMKSGMFDEIKIVFGAKDIDDARKIYLQNYEKGWERNIMNIIPTNTKKLRDFFKTGNYKEPFSDEFK